MELTAKLIQVRPLQTGMGKMGEWRRQDIILETDGQYAKKICVAIWGDRIRNEQLQVGNMLKINFDIESREVNDRWYTSLKAFRIEVVGEHNTPAASNTPPAPPATNTDTPPTTEADDKEKEDLPF